MAGDGRPLSLDDVAEIARATAEEVRRWQKLGLLPVGDTFTSSDVERARLVAFAARRGVPPHEVARICEQHGDMLEPFVTWALRSGSRQLFTRQDVTERSGLSPDVLERIWAAAGLGDQTHADEEDLQALEMVKTALDFGLPLDTLTQVLRVFADASARMSDAATRLFHLEVHERFRAQGLRGAELMAATQAVADPMTGMVEPAVLYFHRKSWERANREDLLLHLMEEWTTPGEFVRTVLFVDLSSFTPLTEAMGDAAATEVIDRFTDIVRREAAAHDGQVVKQIGDEFMVVFAQPDDAVMFGLAVQADATAEDRFPDVRLGANCGALLYREGDYYGAAVNLAARVASAARRGQFLATKAIVGKVTRTDLRLVSVGDRPLKGFAEPVELFEVQSSMERNVRFLDPVCGMGLASESAEASVTWSGRRFDFCSEACLRRFMQQPDHYAASLA